MGRALRELQLAGLIERRPGSGSFVGTGPGEDIRKNVAGVFFAPLERSAESDETNQRIIFALERVHIPVVSILRE